MNLGTIESDIYDTLNLGRNPDSSVTRRIRRYINDVQREVLTRKNIGPRLRTACLSFTTQSASPFCTLPQAMARIFIVTDRTNNNVLDEMSLQDLRFTDPGLKSSSAIPYAYEIYNLAAPVATDPAAATQLFLLSDSANDGTGLSVNVEGLTSDGQYFKASVSLNGTVQVALSAVATWTQITKFYLSAPAAGHVSLKTSGGTTLGQISPGRTLARYTRIHMFPSSTAVLALTVDGELRIEDMVNPSDEPYVPEDFHDVFVAGALAKEYGRREKAQATTQDAIKERRIRQLQVWLKRPTGISWWNERNRRFSMLGPWFPSGS